DDVAPDDTFASLGGDSLSYVEASLHVEERLGHLPTGWHLMTVARLEALAGQRAAARSDAAARAGGTASGGWIRRIGDRWLTTRSLETGVVLRAVAILLIVGTHAHVFKLQGTAHALLLLVGYNLARFALGAADRGTRVRRLLTALRRIAAPAVVVAAAAHIATGQYALSTLALLNWVFGEERLGPDWRFWFIESTVAVLLLVTAVVATPWGDRLERRHPFALPLALAGLGMLWWKEVLFPPVPHMQGSPAVVAWLFFLGWAAARADGVRDRVVVTLVAIPLVGTFSGNPRRDLLTLAAALLVLWVPTLRVPRGVVPAVHVLAASSLFVYVLHWQVLQAMRATPWLSVAAGLAAGILYWLAWTRGPARLRRLREELLARRARSGTPVDADAGAVSAPGAVVAPAAGRSVTAGAAPASS
ncbi:MAG TPA: acyl carrier protein, partial [Ornithinibacter sp.]|nr:acyl carrier protein [Ornithinibacter sp.]